MPREMSGSLSKNERKGTEKHPDYKGSCQINGVGYWIAAWIRFDDKTNKPWLSLSFSQKSAGEAKHEEPVKEGLGF